MKIHILSKTGQVIHTNLTMLESIPNVGDKIIIQEEIKAVHKVVDKIHEINLRGQTLSVTLYCE